MKPYQPGQPHPTSFKAIQAQTLKENPIQALMQDLGICSSDGPEGSDGIPNFSQGYNTHGSATGRWTGQGIPPNILDAASHGVPFDHLELDTAARRFMMPPGHPACRSHLVPLDLRPWWLKAWHSIRGFFRKRKAKKIMGLKAELRLGRAVTVSDFKDVVQHDMILCDYCEAERRIVGAFLEEHLNQQFISKLLDQFAEAEPPVRRCANCGCAEPPPIGNPPFCPRCYGDMP